MHMYTIHFYEGMYALAVWAHDKILVKRIVGRCFSLAPVILAKHFIPISI
jgi:hypothetical protein